jgi:hypothetical protein
MKIDLRSSELRCQLHGIDLTELVRRKLEAEAIEVTSLGVASIFGKLGRSKRMKRVVEYHPFLVIVQCPGPDGKTVHRVSVDGEFRVSGS